VIVLWSFGFIGSLTSPAEQTRIHPWSIPPFTQLADAIDGLTTNDDALIFLTPPTSRPPDVEPVMLDYYTHDIPLRDLSIVNDTRATTDAFWAAQVEEGIKGADRILISHIPTFEMWRIGPLRETLMPGWGYAYCGAALISDDVNVLVFGQPWARSPYGFRLDDGAVVEFTSYTDPTIGPDGNLHVSVAWDFPDPDVTAALPNAHSVGIHIEAADGTLMNQADKGITAYDAGCLHHLFPVDNLPPGDYVVKAMVYRWETGERLPSTTPTPDGERPTIGTFTLP
jgi:hypothetical protein